MSYQAPLSLDLRKTVSFTVPHEPVSKARHRVGTRGGKVFTYKDQKTANAQQLIGVYFRQASGPWQVDNRGFGVDMTFFLGNRQRRDVDNFVKLVLDGLTKVVWEDDSQVTEIHAKVVHGDETPRSEITVYPTDDLPDRLSKPCNYCGRDFQVPKSWSTGKKYCSPECRTAAVRMRNKRACVNCNAEFQSPKPSSEAKYCSTGCRRAHQSSDYTCVTCGKTIRVGRTLASRRKYCSVECQAEFARQNRAKNARGTCCDCGGHTSKRMYSRCRHCELKRKSTKADKEQP